MPAITLAFSFGVNYGQLIMTTLHFLFIFPGYFIIILIKYSIKFHRDNF